MPLVDPVTMSTPSKASPAASVAGKSTDTSAQPHPVHTHPTAASQAARHALPVAIAALFVAAFGRLVADPVAAMWSSLPVVLVLQALYALVCLPAAGSTAVSGAGKPRKPRAGDKLKKAADASGPNLVITVLLALLLALLLTPLLHATMILLGAPLLTHAAHTFLCAAHLCLLAVFPLIYVHGVDPAAWVALASLRAPLDEACGGLLGGFLGAWLGAVPIPLDWDREWQKWPVTILTGMYAGYVLGRVAGGTVLFGKRF